ncbi:MAG: hypothetical protein KatS3mg105_2272 [Gemmatales bacterium]|nr:MAG: hypothetical protein KatS3mg105_2272 [Gemmatales bacterium]
MKRLATAFCGWLLLASPLVAAENKAETKKVDLVICLDTSNSMDGLINSAKAKLWDIVNELASAKPTPKLRVALYSYGNDNYDRGKGYIRKDLDLTDDLDLLYQKLFALQTRGGTEYATRVARDAIRDLAWSKEADALKIVFVCGNEPANQDRTVGFQDVAELAAKQSIIVNTIYCGQRNHRDARSWQQFASAAGGEFTCINQNRGTVAIATPHDKKLAELSQELNKTYVVYGGAEGKAKQENQVAQDANARRAGQGVFAARALAKASTLYNNASWDLVDRMLRDPKFDIKKIPEEQLSEELKKLKTPEARLKYLKDMAAKRAAIQKEIQDLSAKRAAYIAEYNKKNPSPADKEFGEAIRATLRKQAQTRGIQIEDK